VVGVLISTATSHKKREELQKKAKEPGYRRNTRSGSQKKKGEKESCKKKLTHGPQATHELGGLNVEVQNNLVTKKAQRDGKDIGPISHSKRKK